MDKKEHEKILAGTSTKLSYGRSNKYRYRHSPAVWVEIGDKINCAYGAEFPWTIRNRGIKHLQERAHLWTVLSPCSHYQQQHPFVGGNNKWGPLKRRRRYTERSLWGTDQEREEAPTHFWKRKKISIVGFRGKRRKREIISRLLVPTVISNFVTR